MEANAFAAELAGCPTALCTAQIEDLTQKYPSMARGELQQRLAKSFTGARRRWVPPENQGSLDHSISTPTNAFRAFAAGVTELRVLSHPATRHRRFWLDRKRDYGVPASRSLPNHPELGIPDPGGAGSKARVCRSTRRSSTYSHCPDRFIQPFRRRVQCFDHFGGCKKQSAMYGCGLWLGYRSHRRRDRLRLLMDRRVPWVEDQAGT